VAAARQHASRARRVVAEAQPPPRAEAADQRRALDELADALRRGDLRALVSLLHPDAVFISDSGGMTPAARRAVAGAENVARLLLGLRERHGANLLESWVAVLVNGEPGYRSGGQGSAPEAVTSMSVRDGRIAALYSVLSPAKLSRATPRTLRRASKVIVP
jgi:RNA polymerase sigma-70 factor (ECF subfamily)